MNKDGSELPNLEELILQTIRKSKPSTMEQLVKLIQADFKMPEQDILEQIVDLQDHGKISFRENSPAPATAFANYAFSSKSSWFWIIVALSAATITLVFTVPETAYPLVYARYAFGSVFILVLPGYAFIKALFPTKEIDNIERAALSIGLSLALVAIIGQILNYASWGIRTAPIIFSLSATTATFATVAIMREYQTKTKAIT